MAEIVFGMAVPHSGMLSKSGDRWNEDGDRDRAKDELWFRNETYSYAELLEKRKGESLARLNAVEERCLRSERCGAALEKMRKAYEAANIDVAVIIGKDQKEIFTDLTPSLAIYTGEDIYNGPPQRVGWGPQTPLHHKAHPELAQHLIGALEVDGFDMTDLMAWPRNRWFKEQQEPVVPHAYGFVYHRIMGDRPPPNVPVLINTFYPPTQPSMARCIAFGRSLTEAIKSWESDARVGIIASGGFSHFVVDEDFDREILGYLERNDFNALANVDDRSYQSGTSEIKLYASVLVAMADAGAKMTLVDYVPCYRTEAGTGEGMGFIYWN